MRRGTAANRASTCVPKTADNSCMRFAAPASDFFPSAIRTPPLHALAQERDWEQFHSPKNLAASLSIETAEVLEHFQ